MRHPALVLAIVAALAWPEYVDGVSNLAHKLVDLTDCTALLLLVEMEERVFCVVRSRTAGAKYDAVFETKPASESAELIDYVSRVLLERDIIISSKPLEAVELMVDGIRWTHVFYESGLAINVLYTLDNPKKRAVGFKLSQGMEVPEELATKFKFARQKSKLAGTIRGSFFVIKGEY